MFQNFTENYEYVKITFILFFYQDRYLSNDLLYLSCSCGMTMEKDYIKIPKTSPIVQHLEKWSPSINTVESTLQIFINE